MAEYPYENGRSYENRGDGNMSRRRDRRRGSRGRYSRGYSGDDETISELRELMNEIPDEHTRQKIKSIIREME